MNTEKTSPPPKHLQIIDSKMTCFAFEILREAKKGRLHPVPPHPEGDGRDHFPADWLLGYPFSLSLKASGMTFPQLLFPAPMGSKYQIRCTYRNRTEH